MKDNLRLVIDLESKGMLEAFFTQHLYDLAKRANKFGENNLFDIKEDVPYIAKTMVEALSAQNLCQTAYWYVQTGKPICIDQIEPVLGREIADGALINLALVKRLPEAFNHRGGVTQVSHLYSKIAPVYPEEKSPASSSVDVRKLRSLGGSPAEL